MKKNYIIFIFFMIATVRCKEKFVPSLQTAATQYLVVEGFINSGSEPTIIHLTRTVKVYDTADIIYEDNAQVTIEGQNNESYPLYDNGNGTYISASLALNNTGSYRLHIFTSDGKEYASDFTTVKHTPDIDSLTYFRNSKGLSIYINTHDATNTIKYYKWDYEETWEFHSAFSSQLKYYADASTGEIQGVEYRDEATHEVDSSIYRCWQFHNSQTVNLGSSEKLTTNSISLPLVQIDPGSEKLSVLYSVKVKQYALSHDAYLFYEKIKKNSEELGSLFDPQPSELQGNIHCINNPKENVVGFIDISEEKDIRTFISNADVPGWDYETGCQRETIVNSAFEIQKSGGGANIPTTPKTTSGLSIVDFYASDATCVDCTLSGTNIKPSFWP